LTQGPPVRSPARIVLFDTGGTVLDWHGSTNIASSGAVTVLLACPLMYLFHGHRGHQGH